MFAGTVADNLRMAAPLATDAVLTAALQQVGYWLNLARLLRLTIAWGKPGQAYPVDSSSGCVWARLLLADRDLWLLDEPFAELDQDTAAELAGVAGTAEHSRTLLIASHQWQQLSFLDGALLLQQGRSSPAATGGCRMKQPKHGQIRLRDLWLTHKAG